MHGTTAGLHGGSGLRQNRIIPVKCRCFFYQIRRVSHKELLPVPGRQIRSTLQTDPLGNNDILTRQLFPCGCLRHCGFAQDTVSRCRGNRLSYRRAYSGLTADDLDIQIIGCFLRLFHQCLQLRLFHCLRQEDHQLCRYRLCARRCQIVCTLLENTTHRHHGQILSLRLCQVVLTLKFYDTFLNAGYHLSLGKRRKNSAVCPQTCAICYFCPFIFQLSENGTFQDVHGYLAAVHCLTFSRLRFLSAQQPLLLLRLTLLPRFSHDQCSLY